MCGFTSQLPFARTPPQGPLRRVFGQFIGQDMPVELSTHWPHMRQSNSTPLTAFLDRAHRPLGALIAERRETGRCRRTSIASKPR